MRPSGRSLLDVSRAVRHRIHANILEHDHRGTPLDDAEEDVVRVRALERDLEPETVAVKRQRGGDILDDEEWRDAGNIWFSHNSWSAGDPESRPCVWCQLPSRTPATHGPGNESDQRRERPEHEGSGHRGFEGTIVLITGQHGHEVATTEGAGQVARHRPEKSHQYASEHA